MNSIYVIEIGLFVVFSWVLVSVSLFGFYLYYQPSWSKWWYVPLLSIPLSVPLVINYFITHPVYNQVFEQTVNAFGMERDSIETLDEEIYISYAILFGGSMLSYCLFLFSKFRKSISEKNV